MATQREEIIVRAGFDNTALATGLRQANASVANFAREAGRSLLAAFSAGAVIAQIDSIFNRVKAIQAGASKTGLNVVDYQKLATVANEELPDGAAKFDSAVTKLNVKLGEGARQFEKWGIHAKTAEAALYEMADRMKSMDDPAQRAAMAVDLMGRGGADLVPLLERGAAALRSMAGAKGAWSREDMEAIADAHKNIEQTQNTITLAMGRTISYVAGFFRMLGRLTTPGSMKGEDIEKGRQFADAIVEAQKAADKKALDEEDAAKAAEAQADAAKRKADSDRDDALSAKERADAAKAAAEADRKSLEYTQHLHHLRRQAASLELQGRKIDQETPTIADLAGRRFTQNLEHLYGAGGRFDLASGTGPFAKAAQQYELAQKQQLWDIIHGNAIFDTAGRLIGGQALEDKQRMIAAHNLLAGAGIETPAMQIASLRDKLNDIYTEIGELVKIASDTGIELKSD